MSEMTDRVASKPDDELVVDVRNALAALNAAIRAAAKAQIDCEVDEPHIIDLASGARSYTITCRKAML